MQSQTNEYDKSLYTLDVIQKAVYRIANQCDARIGQDKRNFLVHLTCQNEKSNVSKIAELLSMHVSDYSLRENIALRTSDIRNLILGAAFSRILSSEPNETLEPDE